MTHLDLTLTPERQTIRAGGDTELHVLAKIAAPLAGPVAASRTPLNLALVIDRSGSMSGQPLREAKRCASFIVDQLTPADRVSIVSFDDSCMIEAPSQPVSDKRALQRAIERIESGGSTALHGGWLLGAEQAAAHCTRRAISRVLLLTDGQANQGLCHPQSIAEDCAKMAANGVSTSTYGLGRHFDERLLTLMASAGEGHPYYGESAEDLMDPFREEFDLLSALFARKVRLNLEAAPGVQARLLNQFRTDQDGWSILPDVAYEGAAWALARLLVPAALSAQNPQGLRVLTAHVRYEGMDGAGRHCAPAHLWLRPVNDHAYAAEALAPEVVQRAQELRAAELQDLAREAAYRGDWAAVDAALAAARAEAGANEWVAESLNALERYAQLRDVMRLSKEAHYKASKMRSRLSAHDEAEPYSLTAERGKAGYLRRKGESGKDFGQNPEGPAGPRR